jgi:hypothetical protein
VRLRLAFSPQATSGSVTLTLKLKLGGTTLATFVSSAWPASAPDVLLEAFVRNLGDAGHQAGHMLLTGGGSGGLWWDEGAVDTTADRALSLTAKWSAAASGNSALFGQGHLERVAAA